MAKRHKSNRGAALHDTISRVADEVSSLSGAVGENASEEIKAAIRSLRQKLDELADESEELAARGLQETRTTIAEHPLTAVGAAFGLGVALALLLRR